MLSSKNRIRYRPWPLELWSSKNKIVRRKIGGIPKFYWLCTEPKRSSRASYLIDGVAEAMAELISALQKLGLKNLESRGGEVKHLTRNSIKGKLFYDNMRSCKQPVRRGK